MCGLQESDGTVFINPARQPRYEVHIYIYTVPQVESKTICFLSLTYISAVLNGLHQSEWAVTSITHHYNKSENLHVLQRKINTCALLLDARPSHPILAVKKVTYIQALRLNTV